MDARVHDRAGTAPPGQSDVNGSISDNHGHTALITSAEVRAGNGVTLNIRGTSDHPHTVNLSGPEVMPIAAGQRVSKDPIAL